MSFTHSAVVLTYRNRSIDSCCHSSVHNLCSQANFHCIMATILNMPLSYFGQQAIHIVFLSFIQLSLLLHWAFCSLFQWHTNKCTYIVFNNLKFTLKHLKRSYMFRSSSGSILCSLLSFKHSVIYYVIINLVLWQRVACRVSRVVCVSDVVQLRPAVDMLVVPYSV